MGRCGGPSHYTVDEDVGYKKNRFWSGCASAATGRAAAMVSGDDTRLAKGGSGNGAADGGAAVHKLPNLIELLPARNT